MKPIEFDQIRDVPVTLTAELGRVKMPISKLLSLTAGSIVELESEAGTPLPIYANDRLVAYGDVVVVNNRYGIRISDLANTC